MPGPADQRHGHRVADAVGIGVQGQQPSLGIGLLPKKNPYGRAESGGVGLRHGLEKVGLLVQRGPPVLAAGFCGNPKSLSSDELPGVVRLRIAAIGAVIVPCGACKGFCAFGIGGLVEEHAGVIAVIVLADFLQQILFHQRVHVHQLTVMPA